MSIGWAIVGIGRHADAVMAPAITSARDSKLVAVWSRDKGRASAFAAKHRAEHAYDSFEELLQNPDAQVVYIASPNSLHKYHTMEAAKAGKHVLCEKPMALTVPDCQAMIQACQQNRVKLGIGFHLRNHPAHIEARRLIQAGDTGRIVLATAQFCRGVRGRTSATPFTGLQAWRNDPAFAGGGAMMGMGVHAIDLLRFLLGQEVVEVAAFADSGTPEMPVDSVVTGLLRFEGGAYGFMVCSWLVPASHNDVVIYGSQCRVAGIGTLTGQLRGELEVVKGTVATRYSYPTGNMYVAEVESFNQCIQEDGEPVASGMDGLRVCQVTTAAFESARTGRAIRIQGAPQV